MRWAAIVVVLLVLLLLASSGAEAGYDEDYVDTLPEDEVTPSSVTNGPRVGPATTVGADGLVDADPFELAAAAGLSPDVYALARCMASEHTNDPDAYLVCVGWAVNNFAIERYGEREGAIVDLLTNGAGTAGDGFFGEQKAAAGTKYASTAQDPHQRHAEIAAGIIAGTTPDPTGGATHFFSPRSQDALAQRAADGDERFRKYLGKDAEYILRTWAAPGGLYPGGAVAVVPPGIDGNRLTLWRAA